MAERTLTTRFPSGLVLRRGFLKCVGAAALGPLVDRPGILPSPGDLFTLDAVTATAGLAVSDLGAEFFRRQLNTTFLVRSETGAPAALRLASVIERPRTGQLEQFSLIFHAADETIDVDGTRAFEHRALGRFDVFIVRMGAATDTHESTRRASAGWLATEPAMSDPFIGQIFLLPYNFPPKSFAFCEGQLLPIFQNTALFSLLGTTYGGDGKSTFALPDLRGRAPLGFGQGPGLTNYDLGQIAGNESVTLLGSEIPQHTHPLNDISSLTAAVRSRNAAASRQTPAGSVPAIEPEGAPAMYANAAPDASMHTAALTPVVGQTTATGGGAAHPNRQPYLALHFCIALAGVFPPQS